MKQRLLIFSFLMFGSFIFAQTRIDKALKKWNKESVPYITVSEVKTEKEAIFLDAREWHEFNVSHLPNALWIGYKNFNLQSIINKLPDKQKELIVYCSIGVRSEDIAEELIAAGYPNVKNLYGGIFEWVNQGNTVYNSDGQPTDQTHAFNKHWGKLLLKGQKVYSVEDLVRN